MSAQSLLQGPEFSDIDRHFASFVAGLGGNEQWLTLAAAALSRSVREGHLCITLARIAASFESSKHAADALPWPTAGEWNDELRKSPAVGSPAADTPLVLDGAGRLYLRRYWNYQARLAKAIIDKCSRNRPATAPPAPATQEHAVQAALRNELTIICGGPGTGKTSTVIRILERLLADNGGQHLRIALTAPTGKAASRLDEARREAAHPPAHGPPQGAKTIHRLLGSKARSATFRQNAENPLPIDVLIVDEASMVALALLAKLFDALPQHCRVLLLGDRDQLASVEPGAVLADMVDTASSPGSPLQGSVVTLEKNYRFADHSGIQQACNAVRRGDADRLVRLLRDRPPVDLISTEISSRAELDDALTAAAVAGYAALCAERDPPAALAKLRQFRVLTPLRHGPWGVAGLNRAIIGALATAGLIAERPGTAYAGRPLLILQNDYELELYNGDLGLLLPDPAATSDQLYAWFPGKENNVRRLAPARLPEHETAYAMTVHKSQGSEFDRVLFVLPESDGALFTRELVYTALTRARSAVEFCWHEPVLRAAVARRAQRDSGLRELLAAGAQPAAASGRHDVRPAVEIAGSRRKTRESPDVLYLPGFEK